MNEEDLVVHRLIDPIDYCLTWKQTCREKLMHEYVNPSRQRLIVLTNVSFP